MSQEKIVEPDTEQLDKPAVEQTAEVEDKATKEELETLMNEGRKAALLQDFATAAEKLSYAAPMSVRLFGYFAPETFNPHYHYGKVLVELISTEQDMYEQKFDEEKFMNDPIIGEIKEGIKNLAEKIMEAKGAEQTEKAEEIEKMAEKIEKKAEETEKMAEEIEKKTEEETEEATKKDDSVVEENAQNDETMEQSEIDIDRTVGEEEEEGEDEEEEEIENSQLAFESLDYARIVCIKNSDGSPEWFERQKNTLVLLGQLALNDDNFEVALNDLTSALELVIAHFPEDYREAAFINMELARVYRKTKDFTNANSHTDNAIKALETLKEKLKEANTEEGTKLLEEIQCLIDEVLDEKNVTHVREFENKENTVEKPVLENKTVEPQAIKRKVAASVEDTESADSKKSKVSS